VARLKFVMPRIRNWDTGRPLTGEGLDDALADPAALVYTAEGVRPIILRLVSKDH
jgi:hypothetical protein